MLSMLQFLGSWFIVYLICMSKLLFLLLFYFYSWLQPFLQYVQMISCALIALARSFSLESLINFKNTFYFILKKKFVNVWKVSYLVGHFVSANHFDLLACKKGHIWCLLSIFCEEFRLFPINIVFSIPIYLLIYCLSCHMLLSLRVEYSSAFVSTVPGKNHLTPNITNQAARLLT